MNESPVQTVSARDLDPEVCRRARLARDARFDGLFFLAVRTTGIYCRPVCPARPPAEQNVAYFREASQAAAAGFRPCLRCRPEAAPGSPAWQGSSVTVQRALELIRAGALNEGSLAALCARLGVGERHLRKLFQRELGVSPVAVAHNQRLLFARQLLQETTLPVIDIAHAAGFGSVRRCNSAFQSSFSKPPSAMRRPPQASSTRADIRLQLQYRPPYDWDGVLDFFSRHAVEGVESADDECYRRTILWQQQPGAICVRHLPARQALELELRLPDLAAMMPVVQRVRRMFDLDANPGVIAASLGQEPALATLLQRFPGLRSPVCWSVEEATVRAIVGQQVSIVAARTVCSRLAAAAAPEAGNAREFPAPAAIAALEDSHFPMPTRRRDTLRAVCQLLAAGEELTVAQLLALPGIGPWTAAMVAMRGHGQPDAFPPRDLGLMRAWEALPQAADPLHQASERWQPWRAYAANLLWRSLDT
ncbi:AlkA N-terminal domain-containing protein [Haliea sp. E1-2-M8]|uniref:AlkA N-terminal domain-containing protein n=1 Tax=Haliea sp. E1-2-M8 TaxID=3064706 RepID=UPI002721A4BB|nr:AlkA N-terminal domain-containing protein [Haliea sp. E1-2-M8]MDO8863376.1 AlkA N-terminal domain-containing protein [Haliea sp. E1-2-M8]